jgi:hypothetical protein
MSEKPTRNRKKIGKPKDPSVADAQKFINMQMQKRMQLCRDEVDVSLNKWGFVLDAIMILRDNSISSQIRLIPKPTMEAKDN